MVVSYLRAGPIFAIWNVATVRTSDGHKWKDFSDLCGYYNFISAAKMRCDWGKFATIQNEVVALAKRTQKHNNCIDVRACTTKIPCPDCAEAIEHHRIDGKVNL